MHSLSRHNCTSLWLQGHASAPIPGTQRSGSVSVTLPACYGAFISPIAGVPSHVIVTAGSCFCTCTAKWVIEHCINYWRYRNVQIIYLLSVILRVSVCNAACLRCRCMWLWPGHAWSTCTWSSVCNAACLWRWVHCPIASSLLYLCFSSVCMLYS